MADNNININITATSSDAVNKIKQVENTVNSATNGINSKFKSMESVLKGFGGSFNGLNSNFISFEGVANNGANAAKNFASGLTTLGLSGGPALLAVAGITASIAGIVSVIDSSVNKTRDLASENIKLGRALNLTSSESVAYRMAIDDAQLTSEEYVGALRKVENTLRSSPETFEKYGISIKDSNGKLLDSKEIMKNASIAVAEHKAGIDQDLAAQELFGKNVDVATKLQKVNNETLKQGAIDAKNMGLAFSQIDLENAEKNRVALKELDDQLDGIQNTIGSALIPILTEVTEFFSDLMPTALNITIGIIDVFGTVFSSLGDVVKSVWSIFETILNLIGEAFGNIFNAGGVTITALDFFKNTLSVIQIAFIAFSTVLQTGFETIKLAVDLIISVFKTMAVVTLAALNLDLRGAADALRSGLADRERLISESSNRIVSILEKNKQKIDVAVGASVVIAKPEVKLGNGGNKDFTPTIKTNRGGVRNSAENIGQKVQESNFNLFKTIEQNKLAIIKENSKMEEAIIDNLYSRNLITVEDYYAEKQKLIKKDYESQIALKQKELQQAQSLKGKDEPERIKNKEKIAKIQGEINLLTLQESNAIAQSNLKLDEKIRKTQDLLNATESRKIATKGNTDLSIDKLEQDRRLQNDEITNLQSLELDKIREQKSYEITLKSLEDKKIAAEGNRDALIQIEEEVFNAEQAHRVKTKELSNQIIQETQKDAKQIKDAFSSGFRSALGDLMSGKKSFKDAMKDLVASITDMFTQLIAKKFADQIFNSDSSNGFFDKIAGGLFGGGDSGGSSGGGGGFGDIFGAISSFLPSFDVGTNYVPNDMVAKIHKGERIVPAKYNNQEYNSKSNNNISVSNNFIMSGQPDQRTQTQIANMAGAELQRAMKRNG